MLNSNTEILEVCASVLDASKLDKREQKLLDGISPAPADLREEVIRRILSGDDVLGESYMRINSPGDLRPHGETYTPDKIVTSMVNYAKSMRIPKRVIDCGCGSGRFSIESANSFPEAKIIAIDSSPFATMMCKCNVAVLGLESRITVLLGDFTNSRTLNERIDGPTLWLGNPPYVRHHDLPESKKKWLAKEASRLGMRSSGLSGLHAYFFLAIAKRYREQDYGVLVTSAEWMDVKYGQLIRDLLLKKLGLKRILLADQSSSLFERINTTTVITCFDAANIGGEVEALAYDCSEPPSSAIVSSQSMLQESKWSKFFDSAGDEVVSEGYVKLGDFARVHRGIVTGANKFWVIKGDCKINVPSIPVISHAREIIGIGNSLEDIGNLSRLIILPSDLDTLDDDGKQRALEIIRKGEKEGVDKGYVASSRRNWWSIDPGKPAAILMTYMARRAPVFVANPRHVRSLNVVHGIYPDIELSSHAIDGLVEYLNQYVPISSGRTYSGGLTKYEPKEVEALRVPSPKMLEEDAWRS